MNVLLIPGITVGLKRTDASKSSMSLGPLALSAVLEKNGFNNSVIDIDVLIENLKLKLDKYFYENVVNELLLQDAQVYGFYVAIGTVHHVINLSRLIKAKQPDAVIILGGPHATAVHDEIITNFREIDFIIRGEGEETIVEVLKSLENGLHRTSEIKGLTCRTLDGNLCVNVDRELIRNLDSIPIPAYHKYSIDKEVLDIIPIDAGRGCPYNCTFCSTSIFWKRSYRLKSVSRIIEEMKYVKKIFKAQKVFLMHDCLTANKDVLRELCLNIKNAGLGLKWGCAARLDHIDEETLTILAEGGCTHLELGIESGSTTMRNTIQKSLQSDSLNNLLLEKLKAIHDKGFSLILFFMCGFAEETEDDLKQTLKLIGQCLMIMKGNGFFRLTFLELFAGTPIYKEQIKEAIFSLNLLEDASMSLYTQDMIEKAKNTNLFPEFYYVKNKNGIAVERFREASSLFSSFIKVLGTEFCHTFKIFMNIFNGDIERIAGLWVEFEKTLGFKMREISTITANITLFLKYIIDKKLLQNIPYLKDLTEYELLSYLCRQHYLKEWKEKTENIIGPVRQNVYFKELEFDIPYLIKHPDFGSRLDIEIERENVVILAYTNNSESIGIMKVSGLVKDIIELCDGKTTTDEIYKIIFEKYGVKEEEKLGYFDQMNNLLIQLNAKNIVKMGV